MLDIKPLTNIAPLCDPKPGRFVPHALLDCLIADFKLKNDSALCRALGTQRPQMSKIRHGTLPVSADMILRVHEKTGMPVSQIRRLIAQQKLADEKAA